MEALSGPIGVLGDVPSLGGRQAAAMMRARTEKMTDAQIEATARDFESVFLSQLFSGMFGDSTGDTLFGNRETRDIYRDLLMNEYGKSFAAIGGIGIASDVKREMLRMQEVSHE